MANDSVTAHGNTKNGATLTKSEINFANVQLAKLHAGFLRNLSDACANNHIPMPMAAMHSKKAFDLLKVVAASSVKQHIDKTTPHCERCSLNLTLPNSFKINLSKTKPPSKRLMKRLRKYSDDDDDNTKRKQLDSALKRYIYCVISKQQFSIAS
ncbi:unnamed protein product [Anisakis simplex]|uniref:CBFD_NFYB_HMF domain-containing protein n=1 Tax=Anisakis simplex TaxID=6269 RepID=A0A0M3KGB3_ANISI|nr:unnamed protein product [Anisakis simplex]